MNRQFSNPTRICAITLALLALSGCRFGNRVQSAAEPEEVTGYYGTLPDSLELCVQFVDENVRCQAANLNYTPLDSFTSTFSNPVGLVIDEETGKGGFLNILPGQNSSTVTTIKLPSLDIEFKGQGENTDVLPTGNWAPDDANGCYVGLLLEQAGKLTAEGKGTEFMEVTLSGRVSLEMTLIQWFADIDEANPECLAMLEFFEACYKDAAQCEGTGTPQNTARQAEVAYLYAPYIESGLITADEISDVAVRQYTVTYK